ncbi:MAG: hypothetical protein EB116_14740 [Betaproteobacteria bacterium]|nr:hypothetical protein [Betaproteobacteria bacterium]
MGENMSPTDTDTDALGRRSFKFYVPSVGEVQARMTPAQALAFVANVEQQIDQLIPRSLRVEPITIAEIDAREALQQARNALALALKGSAVTIVLSEAIDALDRVLSPSEVQS